MPYTRVPLPSLRGDLRELEVPAGAGLQLSAGFKGGPHYLKLAAVGRVFRSRPPALVVREWNS